MTTREEKINNAWAEYGKICAIALAEYEKICDSAEDDEE